MDFDTRADFLEPAPDTWDARSKESYETSRTQFIEELKNQYGTWKLEQKIANFKELGTKPFSIVRFHNKFLEQSRNAFVIGSYYPALTAACALGERLLNHLILGLRENYRNTPEFKIIHRKASVDYWPLAIDTLQSWAVLLPDSATLFRELKGKRDRAIHFNPETDSNDRALALDAILLVQKIINSQFSVMGTSLLRPPPPWVFSSASEFYIRHEFINAPFVKLVYLPSCRLVGPKHIVESVNPWAINDNFEYEARVITDEEFSTLRKQAQSANRAAQVGERNRIQG